MDQISALLKQVDEHTLRNEGLNAKVCTFCKKSTIKNFHHFAEDLMSSLKNCGKFKL